MNKISIVLFFVILCCILSACSFIADPSCKHVEVIDQKVEPTCFTSGLSEGKHCSVCNDVLVSQIELPPLEHDLQVSDYVPLSCTKWSATGTAVCTVCNTLVYEQSFIKPIGHSYVNGKCTACLQEEPDFTDISQYESRECDLYFNKYSRGYYMRQLYDEMDAVLTGFHSNPSVNAAYYCANHELGDLYTVGTFDYTKHGLTLDEAKTVYSIYRKDHPVFYWMSYWLYWSDTTITITTVKEYANGSDRMEYNDKLYKGIEEYALLAEGETSPYNIALIYYDAILNNNSYAYNDYGGVESAQWAHSIMGDFLYDKFVCEGYAKLFQLLLNYSGIENMYICGEANGSHLWNLVRMDDGNWYWFDLTWGDTTQDCYKYFCSLDYVMTTHVPTPSNQYGMYFNATLPLRPDNYNTLSNVLKIGDEFTVNEEIFYRTSCRTVRQIQGEKTADSMIVYDGRIYTIIE